MSQCINFNCGCIAMLALCYLRIHAINMQNFHIKIKCHCIRHGKLYAYGQLEQLLQSRARAQTFLHVRRRSEDPSGRCHVVYQSCVYLCIRTYHVRNNYVTYNIYNMYDNGSMKDYCEQWVVHLEYITHHCCTESDKDW